MILYHGSNVEINKIDLSRSKPNKDFGKGFYLSVDEGQALKMASFKALSLNGYPVVTRFDFDEKYLTDGSLKYKAFDGYTDEWAQFVLANRSNPTPDVPIHAFDVIYGPIANDKVGLQIRRLENGDIDFARFVEEIKYIKGITFQYFFGTDKAINCLKKI